MTHQPHRHTEQGPRPVTSQRTSSQTSARRSRLKRLSGTAVIAIALGVVGLGYTAFAAPSTAQEDSASQQSLAIREGKRLYDLGCSTCHGLNLQGGSGGPSLVGVGAASVVFQMESGRMPLHAGVQQAPRKPAKYSLEEIDQIAAFIQANGGGPEVPEGDLTDGDLQLGGDLFRTNCASCHNFAGSGGALTYGKYAPDLNSSSARVIYTAMQSGPESMPRYSDNQLSPEEKRAITRYVTYLANEKKNPGGAGLGRYGPVSEGLVAWLVGITALVGLTLWIGARS
jgi:ubiquinol-cytochrome c reductase cytochrome c subunit